MNLSTLKEKISSITEIIYFDPNEYLREKTSKSNYVKNRPCWG